MSLKRDLALFRAFLQKFVCCQIPFRFVRRVKFPHPVGIIIGDAVRIGRNVQIYQNVTIGLEESKAAAGEAHYPTIGDDVVIYAGAVIAGGIVVGDRSVIGANAVITRDVPADCVAFGYNQIRERKRPMH